MTLTTQLGAGTDTRVPNTTMKLDHRVTKQGQNDYQYDTESNSTDSRDDGELSDWSSEDSELEYHFEEEEEEEEQEEQEEQDEPPVLDLSEILPVRTFIPLDIWLEIFSVSEPRWLARARRVSKTFKTLIDNNNDIWKRARWYSHPNYPEPMFGLTEMQMWGFRWGRDCTVCGTRTGKIAIHWQFQARLCGCCSRKYLIHENHLARRSGFKKKWIRYLFYLPAGLDHNGTERYKYYLKDVESLEEKMKTREGRAWVKANKEILKKKVVDFPDILRKLGIFEQYLMMESMSNVRNITTKRDKDIRERCLLLSPPLRGDVLCRIAAYSQALKVVRPLTNWSWEILREKLEAGRKAVEETIREEEERERHAKERAMAKLRELGDIWELAKSKLAEYIDEFSAENGGIVKEGFEGSFAIHALQYARKKWFEAKENNEIQLPLGMVPFLAKAKLIGICNGKKNIFSCRFCRKSRLFDARGLFSHVLSQRHEHDEELKTMIKPIDSLATDNFTYSPEFTCVVGLINDGGGAQWLENLPMRAPLLTQSFPGPSGPGPASFSLPQTIPQTVIHATDSGPGRIRAIMNRELAGINDCQIPTSVRLFMWFRLSISSYIREYDSLPDIMTFVAVAGSLHQGKESGIFNSLSCGACRKRCDNQMRSLTWRTLGEHFVNGHRKLRSSWFERLVKRPTTQEVYYTVRGMKSETGQMLIKLMQEVDAKLAGEILSLRVQKNCT